jgi:hypothetical protein
MGVSLTAINWLANVQSIVYVILSFFTGWIFETMGVKKSVSKKKKQIQAVWLKFGEYWFY